MSMRWPLLLLCLAVDLPAAGTVPTDIKLPGTQQTQVPAYASPDTCDNCHGGYNSAVEPAFLWRGGMMANALRDGLFWATVAVAEQDFLPGADPAARGGAGDLCIRCHSVNGWMAGRSTPTDGSGLSTTADINGVECEFCHLMVDPDPPLSIAGTTEVQSGDFLAYDPLPHPPGETYRGAAQYVINGNGTRLGPYANAVAKHQFIASPFHRKAEFCATCHDVSNPAVGDLAPNNGAQAGMALAAGTFSGTVGTPVAGKAAFNNAPHKYGIVERTYSEWVASGLDTLPVNNFNALPAELKVAGGALQTAYGRAYTARSNANYEDGAVRYYTCQTCHMWPTTGLGCNKAGTPTRTDLPMHDQSGGQYWMPDVVKYMNTKGTLRFGGGLTQVQIDALTAGKTRGEQSLAGAARLSASQVGSDLLVRVTNLTGHKLISGYPEGRRVWINIRWYDAGNILIAENGAYGNIGRSVPDNAGVFHAVQSILDPSTTRVYEAEMGMDQAWAAKLISLGYPEGLVISSDRLTDATEHTLGELAASPAGTQFHSFHFVLNNVVKHDNRIPPYGFKYDEARIRNILPVPAAQFNNPGPGGTYNHWDDVAFAIPAAAASAQVRLYYQQTSWEYIHFLWKQNDGLNAFLKDEGKNMLDAWLNTGMSTPFQMHTVTIGGLVPPIQQAPGEASHQAIRAEHMRAAYDRSTGRIQATYTPACAATNHVIYYGNLSEIATYAYSGAQCFLGDSGTTSFAAPPGNVFFLIAGHNAAQEGSYGKNSAGMERPEAGTLSGCDFAQTFLGSCEGLRAVPVVAEAAP